MMKRRYQDAVSLVEVLFALSILSLALFGTITALATSSQVAEATRDTVDINELLQDRIEFLRSVGPQNVNGTLTLPITTIAGLPLAAGSTHGSFTFTTGGLKDAQVTTVILDEKDASDILRQDTNNNGIFEGNDADNYDLDGDGTAGEVGLGGGASDQTQYRIIPVLVTITYKAQAQNGGADQRRLASYIYPTSYGAGS